MSSYQLLRQMLPEVFQAHDNGVTVHNTNPTPPPSPSPILSAPHPDDGLARVPNLVVLGPARAPMVAQVAESAGS